MNEMNIFRLHHPNVIQILAFTVHQHENIQVHLINCGKESKVKENRSCTSTWAPTISRSSSTTPTSDSASRTSAPSPAKSRPLSPIATHRSGPLSPLCLSPLTKLSQGVLHLDVKPGNCLVADDAHFKVKLADFGCSQRISGEPWAAPLRLSGTSVP